MRILIRINIRILHVVTSADPHIRIIPPAYTIGRPYRLTQLYFLKQWRKYKNVLPKFFLDSDTCHTASDFRNFNYTYSGVQESKRRHDRGVYEQNKYETRTRYWPGGSVHMACQHGSARTGRYMLRRAAWARPVKRASFPKKGNISVAECIPLSVSSLQNY